MVHGDKFISSIGLIGGSKDQPLPIGEGCSIQEDNVAVEFNIPPCESAEAFHKSINYTLKELAKRAKKFDLKFTPVASAVFDQDQLDNPMAQQFGCEPDFNAWTNKRNPRPQAKDANLRSAGGHVHVGYKANKVQLIRAMDLFLGVPSTKLDTDTRRRELYGKAGCFRPKSYGAEYRTLSNFWIWDKGLIDWVYHQTSKAVKFVSEGNTLDDETGVIIQDCINNGNTNAYNHLTERYAGAF
jgi:hypothetical protein